MGFAVHDWRLCDLHCCCCTALHSGGCLNGEAFILGSVDWSWGLRWLVLLNEIPASLFEADKLIDRIIATSTSSPPSIVRLSPSLSSAQNGNLSEEAAPVRVPDANRSSWFSPSTAASEVRTQGQNMLFRAGSEAVTSLPSMGLSQSTTRDVQQGYNYFSLVGGLPTGLNFGHFGSTGPPVQRVRDRPEPIPSPKPSAPSRRSEEDRRRSRGNSTWLGGWLG